MNLYVLISATIALALSIFSFPLLNNYFLNLTARRPSVADLLIVRNGTIFTSEKSLPFADSMAIRNGKIVRVGNYSFVRELAEPARISKELNLHGKVVVPGFIDSHVHLIPGGLQMMQVKLQGVKCKDEFVRRIKEAVKNLEKGSWLLGGGWNNDLWGGDLPMASWIDDVTRYNPVWLVRMDGHMGLANSVALQLAEITSLSEDPDGGSIMKTSSGEPTGLLIDAAMELILPWIPEVSVDKRREALLRASNLALMRGVTTVVDFGRYYPGESVKFSWEDFSDEKQHSFLTVYFHQTRIKCLPMGWYFGEDEDQGLLIFSSADMVSFNCMTSPESDLISKIGHGISNWIYLGGVKAFADGSLGSNSALFYEPYVDEPNSYGLQVTELGSLLNMTMASDKSGLQVAIHAIGDRANDEVLDMYKSVAATNGKRDRRFRIEHAQHLAPGTAPRFGDEGIIASVQLLYDADSARKKLGMDRADEESYLFQSISASNGLLALGSDWPVADINPLGAIRTAMKRTPPDWDNAWIPSERISLTDALTAHTLSAARACFLENDLGSLSPGKLADFVILSTSWEDFVPEGAASIEATYVSGVQAYP